MIKKFFAGANTGVGFINNFKNINDLENGFTYIIKGGSGTGKSSLMKRIGEHFKSFCDIEYFYCSTDIKSLDGVRLKNFNIAILDGTAPHIMDSMIPGVCDKIINVGQFIKDDIKKFEIDIRKIIEEKKILYKKMYLYLESARKLLEVENNSYIKNLKYSFEEANKLFMQLNLENKNKIGGQKELFFEAIQPKGIVNLLSENTFKKCYFIEKDIFLCDEILSLLKEQILSFGYDVYAFLDVVYPKLLKGLYLPELDILIYSKDEKENEKLGNYKRINDLIFCAGKNLEKAKILHSNLEQYYIQNVNFKEIDKMTKKLILEIEKRVEKQN